MLSPLLSANGTKCSLVSKMSDLCYVSGRLACGFFFLSILKRPIIVTIYDDFMQKIVNL